MEARCLRSVRSCDQQAMSEAHFPTRVPGGRDQTQTRGQSTRVLRWTSIDQCCGSTTQHGIQIGQHQHPDWGISGIHPGQQDTGRCCKRRWTTQQDDHTGHGQLEQFTVGRGDRTPTCTADELAHAGL